MDRSPQFSKALARMRPGRVPVFSHIADIVRVGIDHDLRTSVLCLRQTDVRRWQRVARETPAAQEQLAVHDLNKRTLSEWCELLAAGSDDLVILAGVHRALARGRIAPDYVTALMDAVNRGTVVLA